MNVIDKIRAEVEKKTHGEQGYSSEDAECGYRDCAKDILAFLDSLEEKEVNLEKEIKFSMNNLYELGCYAQSLLENPEDYEGFAKPFPKEVNDEIANFAKHFFELGLRAKGE